MISSSGLEGLDISCIEQNRQSIPDLLLDLLDLENGTIIHHLACSRHCETLFLSGALPPICHPQRHGQNRPILRSIRSGHPTVRTRIAAGESSVSEPNSSAKMKNN